MAASTLTIRIKINYPMVLGLMLLLHFLTLIYFSGPKKWFANNATTTTTTPADNEQRQPLKIKDIRTIGAKKAESKNNTYLNHNPTPAKDIGTGEKTENKNLSRSSEKISFKDLSLSDITPSDIEERTQQRPGMRPEVGARKKVIEGISLKGREIKKFMQNSKSVAMSGDDRANGLSTSDVMVKLEVPEGVNPDELNEYEMMFYSFQRRTAINYVNSFYKNLDRFQRENPHKRFPLTETKQLMTGRLTYDEKGNIKQIKMMRWSNIDRLQDFFVDVLKDMDTLHNPPRALWEKDGEFSIFFSLMING
jgi:hypothetical protein